MLDQHDNLRNEAVRINQSLQKDLKIQHSVSQLIFLIYIEIVINLSFSSESEIFLYIDGICFAKEIRVPEKTKFIRY